MVEGKPKESGMDGMSRYMRGLRTWVCAYIHMVGTQMHLGDYMIAWKYGVGLTRNCNHMQGCNTAGQHCSKIVLYM